MKISGPFLNYKTEGKKINYSTFEIDDYSRKWKLKKFSYIPEKTRVRIDIEGSYKSISVDFELTITADGHLKTRYSYSGLPDKFIREAGIRYTLDTVYDEMYWNRQGYWSIYPEEHLSALSGKVQLYSDIIKKYREEPQKRWTKDSKSFYYSGTEPESPEDLTMAARATKENCLEYSLLRNGKKQLIVAGRGKISCRLEKNGSGLNLYINSILDYTNLNWGNFERMTKPKADCSGEINLLLLPKN